SSSCSSEADRMSISSTARSLTAIEVRLRLLDRELPCRVADVRLESERLVDAEHGIVRVGVSGPDVDHFRTLLQQPFDVDRLEPLAQCVSAVFGPDAGPTLSGRLRVLL